SEAVLAYHIRPLRARGLTGRGLTVAIASYSSFALADADRFAADLRLKGPRPRIERVAKGVQPIGIGEANLDVDVIRGIVPGAQVIVYEAPNTGAGERKMYHAPLAGPATIVSDSWGFCDSTRGLGASEVRDYLAFRNTGEKALKRLAAAGITVYVAS